MKFAHAAICCLTLAACHQHDLGTGANTVEREYARSADKIWSAAVESAKDAGLAVLSERKDGLGGTLVAQRATGEEVRVVVTPLHETRSKATVRVGPGDLTLARLLHERIAENAGMGDARAGFFGGDSEEGSYAADVATCGSAARRTMYALKYEIVRETNGRIDARASGSTPVGVEWVSIKGKTRVTFIAGEAKSAEHREMARRMKEEFETNAGILKN
ncbi:MAG TPA: DUF3568 family protein [Planctomycetota bacterium]